MSLRVYFTIMWVLRTPPLKLACPTESQRRKNKKGKALPRPPGTLDSDERVTNERERLMVRQIGAKKVHWLTLLRHVSVNSWTMSFERRRTLMGTKTLWLNLYGTLNETLISC